MGGIIPSEHAADRRAGGGLLGWLAGRQVPAAPPLIQDAGVDFHIVRSSIKLVSDTMHVRRLFLAICAISFLGAGDVLAAQFPPLVKNMLGANQDVATLFLAIFSVGVAIGSIAVNRLLGGAVSARCSPPAALVMGAFVCDLWWTAHNWPVPRASCWVSGVHRLSSCRAGDDRPARGGDRGRHVRGTAVRLFLTTTVAKAQIQPRVPER